MRMARVEALSYQHAIATLGATAVDACCVAPKDDSAQTDSMAEAKGSSFDWQSHVSETRMNPTSSSAGGSGAATAAAAAAACGEVSSPVLSDEQVTATCCPDTSMLAPGSAGTLPLSICVLQYLREQILGRTC